ncbi:hypothetical protein [Streptomyces smyrnaeus]|uniref:hypothetical protein n=1 Tax=Streptomyces smyrnaeus TaxID=1387713 RepID=UPI0033C89B7F
MTDNTKKTTRPRPLTDTNALTGARAQIFQALTDHPGSNAATLAVATGLGRSTAGKALAALEGQGIAVREKGSSTPGNTAPDLWYPHPDTAPGQAHPLPGQETEPKPDTVTPETASTEDEGPATDSTDSGPQSRESAQEHPDTESETGAPHTADRDHNAHPEESSSEPAPQQEDSAHVPDPGPESTHNPSEDHTDAAPLDDPTPTPQPGDDAPVQEMHSESPSKPAATASKSPSVTSPSQPSVDLARPEPGKLCPTCGHWRPSETVTDSGRLRPGALREMVTAFLAAHPDEAFTATKISRHLEHSSGAIANNLVALTKQGIAKQVSESPRRYQYAPQDGAPDNANN